MKLSKRKFYMTTISIFLIILEIGFIVAYQLVIAEEVNKQDMVESQLSEECILTEEEQEVLKLINEYRAEFGLKELVPLNNLQEVAKLKATDLVENDYFAHDSPNLGTPFEMLQSNNVHYTLAGENLAGNQNPSKAVKAWINSEPHRLNILNHQFQYTGICVVDSPVYGKVFVQLFIGI